MPGRAGASKRQKGGAKKFRVSGCSQSEELETLKKTQEKFRNMGLDEKRTHYKCRRYFTREELSTWKTYFKENEVELEKLKGDKQPVESAMDLSDRVAIWRGDITALEIDCIVNAANETLLGGGGVDGAIHSAAGNNLRKECLTLNGCYAGEAKATDGYKLPAKYVIHTVGPRGENPDVLKDAYHNSLSVAFKKDLTSMAFPCVSTGIFGYPNEKAAEVALSTVQKFLQKNTSIELVIFCLFLEKDWNIYRKLMQLYFPVLDQRKKESLASAACAAVDEDTEEGVAAADASCASSTKVGDIAEESKPSCKEDASIESCAISRETDEGDTEEQIETQAKELKTTTADEK